MTRTNKLHCKSWLELAYLRSEIRETRGWVKATIKIVSQNSGQAIRCVHLYICVKITTNTYSTQSQVMNEMYVRESLRGQSLGFHCFIAILKVGNESIDLISSGMSSHIVL